MRYLKSFLHGNGVNSFKHNFKWNTIAGLINAAQSLLITMFITRTMGLRYAGIYSLSYSVASLSFSVGTFSVRNFQVTDINDKYSFKMYCKMRKISVSFMLLIVLLYCIWGWSRKSYSVEKIEIIFLVTFLKAIDAIEDLYDGFLQKEGRLDISGKIMAMRTMIVLLTVGVMINFTFDLVISLFVASIVSVIVLWVSVVNVKDVFLIKNYPDNDFIIKDLILECYPLFLSSFLALYISSASKYAIDNLYTEELQAIYGFISMPIFVIALFTNFLYQPILIKLVEEWKHKKYFVFLKRIFLQVFSIILVTIVIEVIAYFWGVQGLFILYGSDVSMYKTELLIILLGSGFYAIAQFFFTVLIILRHQKGGLICYLVGTVVAKFFSEYLVGRWVLYGAALFYLCIMIILTVLFGSVLGYQIYSCCKRNIKID